MEKTKGTILIADDEESIRSLLSHKLEAEGYDCEVAADGREALWKAFMKDFDIVLLDIKMPGLSGMEILSRMLIDHPDTSVVMVTAVVNTKTAVEAMREGAYDYVTKPFDLEDLSMRIGRALERRRLVLEARQYQRRLEQKVRGHAVQIDQDYEKVSEALAPEMSPLEELRAVSRPDQVGGKEASGRSGESPMDSSKGSE